jgi:multicomponent Na+:H+ antiporter subunit D
MILALPLAIAWFSAVLLAPLNGRRRWVGWLAIVLLSASFAALLWLSIDVLRHGANQVVAGGWEPGVGITLRADALGIVFAVVSIGALLVALIYEVLSGVHESFFPALVLFMATGLTGLFLTGDVFNFYVFFEISMASAFVLSGYGREQRQLRAALIFTVVNLLGSVIFLSGVTALYHVTGTLDMGQISRLIGEQTASSSILIGVLFLVAFSIKLGLFPFHFWLPPIYRDSWPSVATIFAGALANIGSYGLIRFGAELLEPELRFGAPVLLVLGAGSVLYGSLQAITVRTSSEALAYSAVGNAGYILLGLAIGGPVGYFAAVLFALVNPVNKVILFLASDLRGWLAGAAFAIGAFSVAGIPPSAGFFGKLLLFQASIDAGNPWLVALIFIGSALSFLYMLRIYQRGFWADGKSELLSPFWARALVLSVALLVVGLGFWPEPMLSISRQAADVLLLGGH